LVSASAADLDRSEVRVRRAAPRQTLRATALVAAALLPAGPVAGCSAPPVTTPVASSDPPTSAAPTATPGSTPPAGPASLTPTLEGQIRSLVAGMSLPDKVGQLFVALVYGDSATTTDPAYTRPNLARYGVRNGAELVDRYRLGGVIYFDWAGNLAGPRQVAALSAGLQRQAMAHQPAVPLLISTDQEGGTVNRLAGVVAASPGNMAVGATFDDAAARRTAAVTGQQLRALGINVDNAPVADVNTNPANTADGTRAFGDRAVVVGRLAAAAVQGLQGAGVAATVKHFPGLGSTVVNTDAGTAVTRLSRAQLAATDLVPFRAAVAAGTDLVMTAHVMAPALDPTGTPASLSAPVVTGLLRHDLGYRGVVVTDALDAGALTGVPPAQRALRAILAGNDQVLMPPDLAGAQRAVTDAVRRGTITEARLDESVTRILRLKARLGLFDRAEPAVDAAAARVNTLAQRRLMADVARRAVTLVRANGRVLPLVSRPGLRVLVTGWGDGPTRALAARVAGRGMAARRVLTGWAPGAREVAAAVAAAGQADLVLLTTSDAWRDAGQRRLVTALLATGRPLVVATLGGPYDLAYLGTAPAALAAYGSLPDSVTAVADVLFGARPQGRLPVTVPVAGRPGSPLYRYGTGLRY